MDDDKTTIIRSDADLVRVTSLCKTVRKVLLRAGRFPAPVQLSRRSRGWTLASLKQWIAEREAEGANAAQLDREAIEKARTERLLELKLRKIALANKADADRKSVRRKKNRSDV